MEGQICFVSVSYTHLDVYKRQRLPIPVCQALLRDSNPSNIYLYVYVLVIASKFFSRLSPIWIYLTFSLSRRPNLNSFNFNCNILCFSFKISYCLPTRALNFSFQHSDVFSASSSTTKVVHMLCWTSETCLLYTSRCV